MSAVRVRVGATIADACSVLECSADELEARNRVQPPVAEWTAVAAGETVGYARAFRRIDNRLFVVPRVSTESAWRPLVATALAELGEIAHVAVPGEDAEKLQVLADLGCDLELESATYVIPFATALAGLGRRRPASVEIVPASQVERSELFALDTRLRNDVPGLAGWAGDRDQFDAEFASHDYDPSGYLVARTNGGELVGLCRMWKNATPALGLLGVVATHRTGSIARELLVQTLEATQHWGAPAFETHTARPALQRRLNRLGGRRTGSHCRMTFSP